MKEELKKILSKYKVKGDTTYGLGYEEAENLCKEIIEKVVDVIRVHDEGFWDYCDTGSDMDWSCRSECVAHAIKRLRR